MSDKTISREALDALLPEGDFWTPKVDGDYDKLLDGIGNNSDSVRVFLSGLAYLRDPQRTPLLSDLEKEFAIVPLDSATEQQRRDNLEVAKTGNDGNGSDEFMETQLQAAGFDAFVYRNDPAVDPDIFLDQSFQMVAGGAAAYAGNDDAFAGRLGGELLVNSAQFIQQADYIMVAGGAIAYAGNDDALAGRFDQLLRTPVVYDVPSESGYWPLIFFVGGVATRNPTTGELTDIQAADIPIERKSEFQTLVLKYKPMHTWAALIVNYV